MSSSWQNTRICMDVLYIIITDDSSSYFLGMIILLSKIGNLTQTRMKLGMVTFSSKELAKISCNTKD